MKKTAFKTVIDISTDIMSLMCIKTINYLTFFNIIKSILKDTIICPIQKSVSVNINNYC